MSNDLGFIDGLTSNSKNKTEPVVLEPDYEILIEPDLLEVELETITVTATFCRDYECGATGIPILPVVFSRDDYRVNGNDKRYFGDGLSSKSAKHDAIASLPTHTYLYCFYDYIDGYGDEQKSVEEIFTGKDGALRRVKTYEEDDFVIKDKEDVNKIEVTNIDEPDNDSLEEMAQPALCERNYHSTLDSKYLTLDPGEIVWLMVSHAKLSKETLKKYFYDEVLRDKRMQKFVADDLTGNENTRYMSSILPELDYINSFHQRKQLAQGGDIKDKITIHEKDLKDEIRGSVRSAFQLYRSMERSISGRIEIVEENVNGGYDFEDGELEKELDQKDLNILRDVKPMMVALPDPVGEVLAAAEKRNYLLKKLDDAQKDKDKIREQVNAIIIDNIRSSIEAGTKYDPSKPQSPAAEAYHIEGRNAVSQANNKNIYDYINESRFKAVLATAKKSRKDKAAIAAARQTFIDAIKRPEFAFVMREDFPENDEDSHAGYAQIIAEAIQGIGIDESNVGIPDAIWADYKSEQVKGMTAKQEFEQSLRPCISGEQPTADNWLSKALIGLDPEDNQKMQDAPTYENLARASDFIGTSTSWVLAFKSRQQQNKINTAIAAQRDSINKLANHKAQILLTMSTNMAHIKDNNKFLYKLDLWSQATVHQSTGFRLAQKVLKYSPEVILNYGSQRLTHTINKAKPHNALLPASIDTNAVGTSSSTKAPIAIDFQKTYGIDQKVIDVFDKAAAGNKTAQTVVTMYTSGESARATQTINQDLEQRVAQLNRDLDPISGQHRQLERQSSGKAALVSAGIGLFQLRSMWIGKSSIGAMAGRGDRVGLEYMTNYASSTLALTSASVDVVNAGIQMKAARSAWVARLGLGVGVLGAVGAGFEV